MKLLLCSEGFHTPNTVQECVRLCEKPQDKITFAVINEAHIAETDDKHWVIDNLNSVANNFPAEMDIVNLQALPLDEIEARIMSKDAIFVVGGHTGYLMSVFVKSGFDKLLPKLLKTKVYVGSSAGSMVMGRRMSEESVMELYGANNKHKTPRYLEIVDFSIVPHMDSNHRPGRREKLILAAKKHAGVVYGLYDDSAVVVEGDKMTVTGSKPIIFNEK